MPVAGGSSRGSASIAAVVQGIRGHKWVQLCADLARGEKRDSEYKRAYGLSPAQVQAFATEFADQIAEIAQAIQKSQGRATAGLWITKKQLRLAELESDVNDVNGLIEQCRNPNTGEIDSVLVMGLLDNKAYMALLRMKRALLASAADEIDGPRRQVETPADERKIVKYLIDTGGMEDDLT